MMNLLANIAPQTGGRALFSARAATPLPNDAAGTTRFDEALRVAHVTMVDIPVDEVVVAGQGPKTEASSADDLSERQTDSPADDQRLALLPSLAPIAAPTPATIAVEIPVATATSGAETSAGGSTAPVPTAVAAMTPSAAASPGVPVNPNDMSLAFERGRAALRAVANTPNSTLAVASEPVAAVPAATAAGLIAIGTQLGASRSGVQETAADRSMAALVSQPQHFLSTHSLSAMSVIGSESLAANAPIQHSAAARQPLVALLGEQLHVQINQRSEHAVIRLDPPSMGSIEIIVRHEAGTVQVQMRASNPEVARQLHAIGDTLRQDLVQRQHGDVSVLVSDGSRDADGRQRQRHAALWQDDPGRALHETGDDRESAAFVLDAE